MINRLGLLLALCMLLGCAAISQLRPTPRVSRTFESRYAHKWESKGRADKSESRTLFLALRERNMFELEDLALDISNPESSSFGNQLSFEDLRDMTAPSSEDTEKVVTWLNSAGITDFEILPAGGFIRLQATHEQIESLLHCQLHTFEHPRTGEKHRLVRAQGHYYLPAHLDDIVEFVAPLHGFPKHPNGRSRPSFQPAYFNIESDPVSEVTPDIIRQRYNVTAPLANLRVNNTQAVFEMEESITDEDLQSFFQQFATKLQGQKVQGFLGDGGNDANNVGTESSLDIQYIAALGGFAPNYYYNYKEEDVFTAFYKYATDLINDPRPPYVHSISYGQYGGDYPIGEVDRISNEFMKLGTRGVSVFVASGDDGVGCSDDGYSFEFPYPSTPWVTFLGSTSLQTKSDGTYTEVGSTFSSGGFSGDFGTAPWQAAAVAKFLKTPNLPTSYFNATGRGLPDVSTVGESFQIVVGQSTTSVDGTSCSAPTFAGMISTINGIRLKSGKKALGFVNPLLYKAATLNSGAFYDVVSGNNGYSDCPGFDAVAGWDPVTGLGTPNFEVLAKYAVSLP